MGKLRLRLLVVSMLAALGVGLIAGSGAGKQLALDERVPSRALGGPVRALIVLPRGYLHSQKRYPVVYFLHGLPAGSSSYRGNSWVAQALASAGEAILVEPQGARDGDNDPEYLDWGSGRNWQTYVGDELPSYVDAHFRTIRSRVGRALVGLSAGGYGASVVGFNHLGRFSVVESWSGYFHATNPAGTTAIDGGPASNVHRLLPRLRRGETLRSTFLAFYVGTGDARFRAENERFDAELTSAGLPHLFELYAGGHETALWRRHASEWLAFALAHLAKP
jgi:putative tributyrin esterase